MRKYSIFWLALVFILFVFAVLPMVWQTGNSYAQVRSASERVRFFNFGTTTLKDAKILKWDTTWKNLFGSALDSLKRVWVIDTSGNAQYAFGSGAVHGDSIKGKFSDTLHTKKGEAHYIRMMAQTAVSNDSVFIYGRNCIDPHFSFTADTARYDTIILATSANGGGLSKYVWTRVDSMYFRFANAGTDCVEVDYRPYLAAVLADSNAINIAGVLVGRNMYRAPTATDTVAADSFGYMAISGDVDVYLSAGGRNIEVGDQLVVGHNGKAIKVYAPSGDTVRPAVARRAVYKQGANYGDVINVTKIRELRTPVDADTVEWAAGVTIWGLKRDTLIFNAYGPKGETPTTSLADSLMYFWMPRGYFGKWPDVIVGKALQVMRRDSTKGKMRLELEK